MVETEVEDEAISMVQVEEDNDDNGGEITMEEEEIDELSCPPRKIGICNEGW